MKQTFRLPEQYKQLIIDLKSPGIVSINWALAIWKALPVFHSQATSESRKLNSPQSTTTRWAVSNEAAGRDGKENPHRPSPISRWGLNRRNEQEEKLAHSRIRQCKPDAKIKVTPTSVFDGGYRNSTE
jgi:hypothetical protein